MSSNYYYAIVLIPVETKCITTMLCFIEASNLCNNANKVATVNAVSRLMKLYSYNYS